MTSRFGASLLMGVTVLVGVALSNTALAATLPQTGNYIAGTGSISTGATSVTVNQTSSRAIITWDSFSIGTGDTVTINNGGGATLNRVTGTSLSTIDGHLNSNGTVYLINSNGIVVGPTGQVVTTGSFIGSTRDINNSTFMTAGTPDFTGSSSGTASNQGSITSTSGDAILIGSGNVRNDGTIMAPNGTAGLAAGNNVTVMQPIGTSKRIVISAGGGNVTNTGTLQGAQAELNAASGNVFALAGNNGGLVKAKGTATINGIVWLTGSSVTVSGTVAAYTKNGSTAKIVVNSPRLIIERGGRIIGGVQQGGH